MQLISREAVDVFFFPSHGVISVANPQPAVRSADSQFSSSDYRPAAAAAAAL